MRPQSVLLVQLALLTSSGYAFFPFQPEWLKEIEDHDATVQAESVAGNDVGSGSGTGSDSLTFQVRRGARIAPGSHAEKVAWQASAVAHKYGTQKLDKPRRSRSGGSEAERLSKRNGNNFLIMQAANPNQTRTTGVDQDGADYAYFIQAHLGSERKGMYMLIDTGAGSSWVMGSGCKSDACSKHNTYGPGDSKSLKTSSDNFTISYGSGAVKGALVKDTIEVADMSLEYQFGLASTTSNDFVHFAFDGILGLSRSIGDSQNFMKTLADAKMLDKNLFSMALNRASDGTNFGEITFGSTNAARYTGDIGYTPTPDGDDWKINLGDMGFDGKKAGVGNRLAWIDSGTSYIFGPPDQVKDLHALIPGAESSDGTTYTVPCDTKKPVAVNFSGVDYDISPEDWIAPKDNAGKCASNIYGIEAISGAWLVGDVFLKNVYAVFDVDGKRIGFAKRSDPLATNAKKPSPATPTDSWLTSGTAAASAGAAQVSITSAAPLSLPLPAAKMGAIASLLSLSLSLSLLLL